MVSAPKNRVFLIGFPEDTRLEILTYKHYKIEFASELEEWVLCCASSILIYEDLVLSVSKEEDFFGEIHIITKKVYSEFNQRSLEVFDKLIGRKRKVNPRQFQITVGSVVRSKVDTRLGAGVVLKEDGDKILVNFPNAQKSYGKTQIVCHPTSLRVVTHIEEVKHYEQAKTSR